MLETTTSSAGRPPTTDRPHSALSRLHTALRQQWARFSLHGVHFSDKYGRLDNLYRIRDPWGMEAEPEQFRFRETNRLIAEQFGRVGSILEIGCGEGHQSRELLRMCDDLVGVDVSGRAIERARTRCPETTFVAGDIFTVDLLQGRCFDLIIACEVLYYVNDVGEALSRFRELGRAGLVTYYNLHANALDPYVLAMPQVDTASVTYGTASWTAAWWGHGSQVELGPAATTRSSSQS